eukprot:scaffold677566_cov37-Prasinocladus_malaysianus.AAC.1
MEQNLCQRIRNRPRCLPRRRHRPCQPKTRPAAKVEIVGPEGHRMHQNKREVRLSRPALPPGHHAEPCCDEERSQR